MSMCLGPCPFSAGVQVWAKPGQAMQGDAHWSRNAHKSCSGHGSLFCSTSALFQACIRHIRKKGGWAKRKDLSSVVDASM